MGDERSFWDNETDEDFPQGSGVTLAQILRDLMTRPLDELAAIGREVLLPVFPPPPLLTTEAVGQAAELQVLRERPQWPVSWIEPAEPLRAPDAVRLPAEVERLLGDLSTLQRRGEPVPLARAVASGDLGDAGESLFRASLLPLVGTRLAGEGIAGRLGILPLRIIPEGDGWPDLLAGPPLSRLTPGMVVRATE